MTGNEFSYTSTGPSSWNIVRTNILTIEAFDSASVTYRRRYAKDDGTTDEGIVQKIPWEGVWRTAELIHWGCTGVMTRSPRQSLIDWLKEELQ